MRRELLAEMTQAELERLLLRLADCINPQEDRLQVFVLHELAVQRSLGRVVAVGKTWVV